MDIRGFLIEDIRNLSPNDVCKLYKYIRRYLIADIEGLLDPLDNFDLIKTRLSKAETALLKISSNYPDSELCSKIIDNYFDEVNKLGDKQRE